MTPCSCWLCLLLCEFKKPELLKKLQLTIFWCPFFSAVVWFQSALRYFRRQKLKSGGVMLWNDVYCVFEWKTCLFVHKNETPDCTACFIYKRLHLFDLKVYSVYLDLLILSSFLGSSVTTVAYLYCVVIYYMMRSPVKPKPKIRLK